MQHDTIHDTYINEIKDLKKEEIYEDHVVDATYLSQDEIVCDMQHDTIHDTYINEIKDLKKEETYEDHVVDATYLSQDEIECDMQHDTIHDTYINENIECKLKENACLKKEEKQLKWNHKKEHRNSKQHRTTKSKYWRLDVNETETDNESNDKEGLIKVLECSKCKKQYQKTKCLINHMKKSCYKRVNVNKLVIVKKYRPAIKKVQKTPTELFCGLCNFSSSSNSDLKQHLNEHWEKNNLQCGLCNYFGKDLAEMVGHRSTHQPYEFFSILANRVCHICDKRCVTIMRLQYHYRSAHLNKDGGLCSVCPKTFRCYKAWRNHERLHKGSRYICDLCGHKFLYRHQIKIHLAEHSDVRSCICDICGKGFKRASYLKEHVNTVHTKEPVKCTHCNKMFKCPANLKEHLKYVNKQKNFQCEVCLKYFSSPTSLKNHMFWHSGERPYSCEKCGAKYKAKSQLKIHMRKHTGQRPYPCEQCDKCFSTSMQLKRHRSVHTGDRPYKCTICTRSFYYKKLLLTHCTLKHKCVDVKSEISSQ
ncbi:unnamed protein product [Parnassius mnemosyne]